MNWGNASIERCLETVRRDCAFARSRGINMDTLRFGLGIQTGLVISAKIHGGADPLLVQAFENEFNFLVYGQQP